jgi:hypothetical protein
VLLVEVTGYGEIWNFAFRASPLSGRLVALLTIGVRVQLNKQKGKI